MDKVISLLRNVSLAAMCLLVSLGANAQSFLQLDPASKYRIVNPKTGGPGVAPGSGHGSDWKVAYVAEGTATADCWWVPEFNGPRLALRNATTGQYISFTPAKDYKTYVRVELTDTPTDRSYWSVDFVADGVRLYYTEGVNYFAGLNSNSALTAEQGTGEGAMHVFTFIDQAGNEVEMPYATPFINYIDDFTLDGKRVPFDSFGKRFLFPAQGARTGSYSPKAAFKTLDDAKYEIRVAGTTGLTFNLSKPAGTLELLRNGDVVATAPIELTFMPVVEMNVSDPGRESYKPGDMRVTDCEIDSINETYIGKFRWRGATALTYPKHSYNVKYIDAEGNKVNHSLLGMRDDNAWILDAMAIDRIRMRNRVCFDLWNEFSYLPYETKFGSRNGTEGKFVEFILNGQYQGIYCLTDKIDRKLLDLKKTKEDEDGSFTIRGVLYKSNSWDYTNLKENYLSSNLDMTGEDWNNWELQYPDDYPCEESWMPLYELYKLCSDRQKLLSVVDDTFYTDNLIDWHLFVMALSMTDNGNKNMFLSAVNITKAKKFVATPWDMDTSLGGGYDGRYYDGTYETIKPEHLRINSNSPFDHLWSANYDNYRNRMAARWNELKTGALSVDNVASKLRAYSKLFLESGAWERENNRWVKGTQLVSSLSGEIDNVIAWYANRVKEMDAYLAPYAGVSDAIATPASAQQGVYNIMGVKVAESTDQFDALPSGFYIVGGRKVLKH